MGDVSFADTSVQVVEGDVPVTATLVVERTGGTEGELEVDYQIVGGSASAGIDYSGLDSSVTFPDGSAAAIDIDITILPDNDDPGRQHAQKVAQHLQGVAAEVRVLDLRGLPEKGDVSDWIREREEEDGKDHESTRATLELLGDN